MPTELETMTENMIVKWSALRATIAPYVADTLDHAHIQAYSTLKPGDHRLIDIGKMCAGIMPSYARDRFNKAQKEFWAVFHDKEKVDG